MANSFLFTFFCERTRCPRFWDLHSAAASSSIGSLVQHWRPHPELAASSRTGSLVQHWHLPSWRWPSQTNLTRPTIFRVLRERFQLWIFVRIWGRVLEHLDGLNRHQHQALFTIKLYCKTSKTWKALCLQFLDFWFLNLLLAPPL